MKNHRSPLEHEADMIREALAEKEYRRASWRPEKSFPLGVVLIGLAIAAFVFDYKWIGMAFVSVYVFCTAYLEPSLFWAYQRVALSLDAAILIASIIKDGFGLWVLWFMAFTHVIMALLFAIVYFIFAEE